LGRRKVLKKKNRPERLGEGWMWVGVSEYLSFLLSFVGFVVGREGKEGEVFRIRSRVVGRLFSFPTRKKKDILRPED